MCLYCLCVLVVYWHVCWMCRGIYDAIYGSTCVGMCVGCVVVVAYVML